VRTKLEFNVAGVAVTSVEFDATLTASHAGDVDITEHPLETGSNVADGARAKQRTVSLEGVIVDNPLDAKPSDNAGAGRARRLYDALELVKEKGGVCTLTTPFRSYDNILIKQLSSDEDKKMGGAVKVKIALTQVKLVRSQTVAVRKTAKPNGQEKGDKGPQSGTKAPESTVRKSMWKKATEPGGVLSGLVIGGR